MGQWGAVGFYKCGVFIRSWTLQASHQSRTVEDSILKTTLVWISLLFNSTLLNANLHPVTHNQIKFSNFITLYNVCMLYRVLNSLKMHWYYNSDWYNKLIMIFMLWPITYSKFASCLLIKFKSNSEILI